MDHRDKPGDDAKFVAASVGHPCAGRMPASAVHKVITEAMRIFCRDIETPAERRRAVMKIYITLYGGVSLYAAGVLDQPSEKALIAELSAMNAGM